MNEKMTSWKLNAYVEYSYFNLIMFMCIFFCCGIPVLLPLGFVNLWSKYITNRSLLQNNSSKIEGLSEKFNSFPLSLLPIMLILSCLFGCWMLTAISSIYPNNLSIAIFPTVTDEIFKRQFYIPFYIILAAVILFYFLFYNLVVRFCIWLSKLCDSKKISQEPIEMKEFSHYASSMHVLASYNIRNNPKYKNPIINLEKYLDR